MKIAVLVVQSAKTGYGAGFGFLGCYIAQPVVRGKGYGIRIWDAAGRAARRCA